MDRLKERDTFGTMLTTKLLLHRELGCIEMSSRMVFRTLLQRMFADFHYFLAPAGGEGKALSNGMKKKISKPICVFLSLSINDVIVNHRSWYYLVTNEAILNQVAVVWGPSQGREYAFP